MNDLTPSFERETGQVTLDGLPAGAAGEAFLTPVPGLDLAFDRVDGRLCRAVVGVAGAGGSVAVGEHTAAMLIRLFGQEAPGVVLGAALPYGDEPQAVLALCPEPELARTLSSLARLYAAQATSPAPACSRWWAAEAAELAERAGLPATPGAKTGPPPAAPPRVPVLNVAAEVESLGKDCTQMAGTQWMLDPGMVPAGLFQFGLSPYSDLVVSRARRQSRIVVETLLAPEADRRALSRCRARLVIPAVRRILAEAGFTAVGSKARAELRLPFRPDELAESWIEVVQDKRRPVRSATGHRTRRALRWADAALRAERAPAALDPAATREDWSALAAAAWDRCRIDWAAAGDADRAYLAARRQAVVDPRACVPRAPSATAAEIARRVPLAAPACLAEAMGSSRA
jgi:hypothetical protein